MAMFSSGTADNVGQIYKPGQPGVDPYKFLGGCPFGQPQCAKTSDHDCIGLSRASENI